MSFSDVLGVRRPRSRYEILNCLVFWVGVLALLVSYGPRAWEWIRTPTGAAPMEVSNIRYRWVAPRRFITESDGVTIRRNCPNLWLSAFIQYRGGQTVGVPRRFLAGPLEGQVRDPRYQRPTKIGFDKPSQILVMIPEWAPPDDEAAVYIIQQQVPNNVPCDDGWTGMADVARIELQAPRELGLNRALPPRSDEESRLMVEAPVKASQLSADIQE